MKPNEQTTILKRLRKRKDELLNMREINSELENELKNEYEDDEGDTGDRALEETELNRIKYLEHAEELELQHIDAALDNIETHHFGICQKCGEPINHQRLLAVPETLYCVKCAERLERNS